MYGVFNSLAEMEAFYKVQLRGEGLAEMETFYKEKLEEERSARKEIEEDFRSFKNRVAPDLALSRRAGNTENMNSPVKESRRSEIQSLQLAVYHSRTDDK
ncbi:uncharacterized protein AKAME5_002894700, partial [Lates japonicus]